MTERDDAFISYSREDRRLSARLSRSIRRYRPPRKANLGKRRLRVFRDEERLTVGGRLSTKLTDRIKQSHHLVLLASPAAAESPWVDEEVAAFLARPDGDEYVLPVLVRGTPETAFPKSLASQTPLFLDLRGLRLWPLDLGRFRRDSLRIIAALYGVDYDVLRREDDGRRRTRRVLGAAITILVAAVIWAGYLVRTIPVEGWARVPEPDSPLDSPIRAVTEFAVNRSDPGIVLWRGINADWVEAEPDAKGRYEASSRQPALRQLVESYLDAHPQVDRAFIKVAVQDLVLSEDLQGEVGKGTIEIYAFPDRRSNRIQCIRILAFQVAAPDGTLKRIAPPPHPGTWRDALMLTPWPYDELEQAGIREGMRVTSSISGPLIGSPQKLEYVYYGPEEGLAEANEITIHQAVLTNGDPESVRIDKEQELPLSEIATDNNIWDRVLDSPLWQVDTRPVGARHEFAGKEYDEVTPLPDSDIRREVARALDAFPGLAQRLLDELNWEETGHVVSLVSRPKAKHGRLDICNLASNHREDRTSAASMTLFIRIGAGGEWREFVLPGTDGRARVVDAIRLDPAVRGLVLATEQHGLFMSSDEGRSWRDASFGELLLRDGERVRLVSVRDALYALVTDQGRGEKSNPLLRYTHRGWLERLRLGLRQALR